MVSFSSWNGEQMHSHKRLIQDVLRGELGFQGLIVSDWGPYARTSLACLLASPFWLGE